MEEQELNAGQILGLLSNRNRPHLDSEVMDQMDQVTDLTQNQYRTLEECERYFATNKFDPQPIINLMDLKTKESYIDNPEHLIVEPGYEDVADEYKWSEREWLEEGTEIYESDEDSENKYTPTDSGENPEEILPDCKSEPLDRPESSIAIYDAENLEYPNRDTSGGSTRVMITPLKNEFMVSTTDLASSTGFGHPTNDPKEEVTIRKFKKIEK